MIHRVFCVWMTQIIQTHRSTSCDWKELLLRVGADGCRGLV